MKEYQIIWTITGPSKRIVEAPNLDNLHARNIVEALKILSKTGAPTGPIEVIGVALKELR